MIKILVCDDDVAFGKNLQQKLERYAGELKAEIKISLFSRADAISETALASCEMAFLDIDLKEQRVTGIDLAKRLRQQRPNAVIVFVTNYVEYAPEGYEVQAFRYLLKKDVGDKLKSYFEGGLALLQSSRKTISLQMNGEVVNLQTTDIVFIEAAQHVIKIHMNTDKRKEYSFYTTISDLEQHLVPLGFLRVHKSYLVNMAYIQKLQCQGVILPNGKVLRVSEKNYSAIKKTYLLWKGI